MLVGLLQGTEAASHGGGDHTIQALPPATQTGREKQQVSSSSSLSTHSLCFPQPHDDFGLTGLTPSQLVAVSRRSVLSVSLSLAHTPPKPPCLTCSLPLRRSLRLLLSLRRPVPELSYIHPPSCLLSSCLLTIHEGGQLFGVNLRG